MSNAKKKMKTTEWGRLEISSKELEIQREHLMQMWDNKRQKQQGPNKKQERLRGKNTQKNYVERS